MSEAATEPEFDTVATRGDNWFENRGGKIYNYKITDEGILMRRRKKTGCSWHVVDREDQMPKRDWTREVAE